MSATEETVVKQEEAQEKVTPGTQEAPETQKEEKKRKSTTATEEDPTDDDSTDDEQRPASRDGSDKDDTVCIALSSTLPTGRRLSSAGENATFGCLHHADCATSLRRKHSRTPSTPGLCGH